VGVVVGVQAPGRGGLSCVGEIHCHRLWWSMAVVMRACGRRNDKNADGVLM